jgi:transcriptional regulator with XRE-family HTH domain
MDTDILDKLRIHHGHNIRHTRINKNMSQEILADKVNLSQQTVSRYEATRVIDDEMIERFAKALDITAEQIKTMEDDSAINLYITNNTFQEGSANVIGENINNNHPIDKIIELCNEKTALYERMLQLEKEKIALLETLKGG